MNKRQRKKKDGWGRAERRSFDRHQYKMQQWSWDNVKRCGFGKLVKWVHTMDGSIWYAHPPDPPLFDFYRPVIRIPVRRGRQLVR